MKHILILLIVLGVVLLTESCKTEDGESPSSSITERNIIVYLDSTDTNYIKDEAGIFRVPILQNDSGKTQDQGQILTIFYRMSIFNGASLQDFDSATTQPTRLRQGAGTIYPIGIDRCLAYMKKGEQWGFIIPPSLAFEGLASNTIPEGSWIYFEAVLLEIQNEEEIAREDSALINSYILSNGLIDTLFLPDSGPDTSYQLRDSLIYTVDTAIVWGSGANPDTIIVTDTLYQIDTVMSGDTIIVSIDTTITYDFDSLLFIDTTVYLFDTLFNYRDTVVVQPDTLDGGIYYFKTSEPTGNFSPQAGYSVAVAFTGRFADTDQVFDNQYASASNPFEFNVDDATVFEALNTGVKNMQIGEQARLFVPSAVGYGPSAIVLPPYLLDQAIDQAIAPDYAAKVTPYRALIIDVELLNVQ